MSSSLVNYASRVLSVDQESSSFVPIVGLNRAPDMPILDAMMLAWRDCAQLHAAIDEDDIEAIATGARMHFMSLSGADPHGLNVDEAASIHVYTQETYFYRVLNQHLRGTDRSKIEPYKPFLKLLLTALHKIPASAKVLYRGVAKALGQLSQKFETGKPVVWWPVTSTASHVSVLENPQFMGKSGSRCMFNINCSSARDIQRYSAMGSKEREYVLIPGSSFLVEDILDAGSGLTIVQMVEDTSMKLLKFTPSGPPPTAPQVQKKTYASGAVYEGEMKDGNANGRGKQTWPSGQVYEGEWKDSNINGRGKWTWPSGQVYEGEFKDNVSHGRGKMTWPDGEVYEGEYKDDKMNGRGKRTYMPSGQVYEGEWKDDKKNGRGKHTWPSGEVYEGEYKDGTKNGRGKWTWPDGQVYEGEWKDDKRNGRGKHTQTSGQVYEGEFKDNTYCGQGTMMYAGGRRESGTWRDDKFLG